MRKDFKYAGLALDTRRLLAAHPAGPGTGTDCHRGARASRGAAGPDPGPDAGREPGTASRRGRGKHRGLGGLLLPGWGCERPGPGCCVFISERPVGGAAGRSCGISLDSPRFQANAPFLNGRSAVRCPPHAGATAQTGTPWLLRGEGRRALPAVPSPWKFAQKPQPKRSHFIEPQGSKRPQFRSK